MTEGKIIYLSMDVEKKILVMKFDHPVEAPDGKTYTEITIRKPPEGALESMMDGALHNMWDILNEDPEADDLDVVRANTEAVEPREPKKESTSGEIELVAPSCA